MSYTHITCQYFFSHSFFFFFSYKDFFSELYCHRGHHRKLWTTTCIALFYFTLIITLKSLELPIFFLLVAFCMCLLEYLNQQLDICVHIMAFVWTWKEPLNNTCELTVIIPNPIIFTTCCKHKLMIYFTYMNVSFCFFAFSSLLNTINYFV